MNINFQMKRLLLTELVMSSTTANYRVIVVDSRFQPSNTRWDLFYIFSSIFKCLLVIFLEGITNLTTKLIYTSKRNSEFATSKLFEANFEREFGNDAFVRAPTVRFCITNANDTISRLYLYANRWSEMLSLSFELVLLAFTI